MKYIDLNCDMGEYPEAVADGTQESLMPNLTSVNIACGGHAGDGATMGTTIEQALKWKLAIGAHPGYADRANFGRLELDLSLAAVSAMVFAQVTEFANVAATAQGGVTIAHVKPHGALYNQAVHNRDLARAIAVGVAKWSRDVVLVGLAGSPMLDVFRDAGFRVAAEAFADRRYERNGTLRSRKYEDALIRDPESAARQAVQMIERGSVVAHDGSEVQIQAETICIHGDTPGAPLIAAAVAKKLRDSGIGLRGL